MTDIWESCPIQVEPKEEDYETSIPYHLGQFEEDMKMWAWLVNLKFQWNELKADCEGFQKLASDSTLRGETNRKKLEAIKTYTEREFKAGYLIKPIDILKILGVE